MDTLKILTYPDPFLKKTARPVTDINGEMQKLIDRMGDKMFEAPGVGLASVQIGVDQSLIVYDGFPGEEKQSLEVLINPVILEAEGSVLSENEGCLSVPDYRADVKRSAAVVVEGFDRNGKPVRIERDDFLAIVLQHEIDHLNGKLFIDRISSLKRQLYKRRVKNETKRMAAAEYA